MICEEGAAAICCRPTDYSGGSERLQCERGETMKRYVKEVANDCQRELARLEQFAYDTAQYYGLLTAEKESEIRTEYEQKRERISELVEQCQYGYISDLKAVEMIAGI